MKHTLTSLVLLTLLLAACQPTQVSTPTAAPHTPTPVPTAPPVAEYGWWNDAVFYEVFVRSFYDSDGDGVGDINGLVEKLDYLNDGDPNTSDDLSVTGIWLMPVAQSPSYHGYDVVDYYQVDDEYGTNEDFLRLMEEAHARGIHVIVDLVLNHTSSQHPWFQEALDPASDRRDWYVWADGQPEGQGWHASASGYYYGYFWDQMPDLNYDTPAVTEAMQDVIRFWLEDMGVDGFRLDAIKHLVEDGRVIENTPATHAWLQEFHTFYKAVNPDALTVGEVWSTTDDVVEYVGSEVDLAFEFDLANALLESAVGGRKASVERRQQLVIDTYPPGQFATFLANHDQNRARSRLSNDEQAKLAATLQLTFPGVPFVYYGEEIGMRGTKPDENIRRPMQWEPDGGFTTGEPWHSYYEDYGERHVAGQGDDPDSLLNHYRALIHLRNAHEPLRTGDWQLVETDQRSVYAFLRSNDAEIILVLVNLGRNPVDEYTLTLQAGPFSDGLYPTLLMGEGEPAAPPVSETGGFDGYRPINVLPPYSSFIIQLGP
ncbi:MAG: alpha-amylase family glycosyl hydrolase [Chloroflexota bacterium]|nr:alpha-amylase family glycosyl hydrolase [Chloroflexota bacterium]